MPCNVPGVRKPRWQCVQIEDYKKTISVTKKHKRKPHKSHLFELQVSFCSFGLSSVEKSFRPATMHTDSMSNFRCSFLCVCVLIVLFKKKRVCLKKNLPWHVPSVRKTQWQWVQIEDAKKCSQKKHKTTVPTTPHRFRMSFAGLKPCFQTLHMFTCS